MSAVGVSVTVGVSVGTGVSVGRDVGVSVAVGAGVLQPEAHPAAFGGKFLDQPMYQMQIADWGDCPNSNDALTVQTEHVPEAAMEEIEAILSGVCLIDAGDGPEVV